MKRCVAVFILAAIAHGASAQQESVVLSPHNLSVGGPGPIRAASEDEVCIFCHVPHNAAPVRPLWNRVMPSSAFTIYTSRALDAEPGQPTGTSKMCLSCHDGTIALGSVLSRAAPITLAGGVTTIPAGPSRIGTDLRDDHPISFRYDSSLAVRDPKIKSPELLPPEIHLDGNLELQCSACHDAHNNALGDFLVMRNDESQLCVACHQVGETSVEGHGNCNACHQPHTAPSGPYLLREETVSKTCLACHDGSHAEVANIAEDLSKISVHDTQSPVDPPDPQYEHSTCADCHEPHTMSGGSSDAPTIHANMGAIDGMNLAGAPVETASFEYQVCFKCHSEQQAVTPWVPRRLVQTNTRLEFDPDAVSYHPVVAPGRNMNVPSLLPGWTAGSVMHCSDCHASDTGEAAGGMGPDGVHGSSYAPLLIASYETADSTVESAQAYALCYRCHDRASILADESFPEHSRHIDRRRASCAACHDAHGIASAQGTSSGNSHLINFASDVVFPDQSTGRLEFNDLGEFAGECYLRCHGKNHSPAQYP